MRWYRVPAWRRAHVVDDRRPDATACGREVRDRPRYAIDLPRTAYVPCGQCRSRLAVRQGERQGENV